VKDNTHPLRDGVAYRHWPELILLSSATNVPVTMVNGLNTETVTPIAVAHSDCGGTVRPLDYWLVHGQRFSRSRGREAGDGAVATIRARFSM
jgi:hypothetical protein